MGKYADPRDPTSFVVPKEALLCVLHSATLPMAQSDSLEQEFRAAVRLKIEEGDCNFQTITFPWDMNTEFADKVLKQPKFRGATFHRRTRFENTRFVGHADFEFVDFLGITTFSNATFEDGATFRLSNASTAPPHVVMRNVRFLKASEVRFQGFDAGQVFLLGSNISDLRFVDMKWPKRLIEDELASDSSGLRQVEELYRHLRTNLERSGNYPAANRFYYGEMDARRRAEFGRGYLPTFITLYWLGSGYGLRPGRALIGIALLMLCFSVAYPWVGLGKAKTTTLVVPEVVQIPRETSPSEWTPAVLLGGLHAFQVATFARDQVFRPLDWKGLILEGTQTALVPLQVALFLLAVQRRFRRE